METLKRRGRVAAAILSVTVLVAITSCFGAIGGPEPPTVEDIEVVQFNETALTNIAGSADPAATEAYGLIFTANIFQLLAVSYTQIALGGWDESQPTEYSDSSGLYTVTWDQSGDTWTWTFAYSDGVDTYSTVIAVTAEVDGWSIVVTQDGVAFLDGTFNSDASSGQVTIFIDPNGEKFVAEWGPSSLPAYDHSYTVSYYGVGGTLEAQLVAHYTTDGTSGEWAYTDLTDGTGEGDGS